MKRSHYNKGCTDVICLIHAVSSAKFIVSSISLNSFSKGGLFSLNINLIRQLTSTLFQILDEFGNCSAVYCSHGTDEAFSICHSAVSCLWLALSPTMFGAWTNSFIVIPPRTTKLSRRNSLVMAGNQTWVNCLKGSFSHHYTTITAFGYQCIQSQNDRK